MTLLSKVMMGNFFAAGLCFGIGLTSFIIDGPYMVCAICFL